MKIEYNQKDLAELFSVDRKELRGIKVLCSYYDCEGYEGDAFVLFERDGKLFEVHASHCSCYGLEDQWCPEETTWEAIAMRPGSSWGTRDEAVAEAKRRVKRKQKSQ